MADSTKPISFRADAETITKLDTIAGNFDSKQEMLAALINAWESTGAKTLLPANISGRMEELDGYINGINRIVFDLANAYNMAKTTAQDQFSAQLAAKDRVIADLQERIANLQADAQAAEQRAQIAIQAAEQRAAEQVAEAQAKLADANGAVLEQVKQLLAGSTGTAESAKTTATAKTVRQKQAKTATPIKSAD